MLEVSLQINCFNRGHLLKNTLERLCKLTLPKEIIIIDDGSNDNTVLIVELFKNRLPIKYIYNHNPEWSIASHARNIGIKNTDCELICTIEPELLPITDFIPQLLKNYQNNPNCIITAGTIYHGGYLSNTKQELINNPCNYLNNITLVSESNTNTNPINPYGYSKVVGWVATFCALYKKEWLLDVGGVDEEFELWGQEDSDLLTRLRIKLGIGQIRAKEIEFVHQWHEKLPPNIQYKATMANETRKLAKNLDEGGKDNPELIANKGKEWGIIKTKN